MAMNYFLIRDMCRDGDHEYYDHIPVKTKMSEQDMIDNEHFWQERLLAWQFGWIEQDDFDDWWADLRIVRIDRWRSISVEDYEVLEDHIGGWRLEEIILDTEGDIKPNDKNESKYVEALWGE